MTPIVSIHCGDWREVAASWPKECVLIMDPPYGVKWRRTDSHSWRNNASFTKRPCRTRTPAIRGDRTTLERDTAIEAIPHTAAAVFGPHRIDRVAPWGRPREILFWDKGEGVGAGDTTMPWKPVVETISIYGKGWAGRRTSCIIRAGMIAYGAENAPNGRKHPNEKPIAVCLEVVRKAPAGLPIVDPFGGSGPVGVAAVMDGRDYYAAEIEPVWFAVMAERLGVTHGPLFDAEART